MRVISLFSGAGGLDLGLIQAGHEVVWANDFAPDAVATYRKNIGSHIACEDISKVDVSSIPAGDAVVGGIPCQGFSQANYQRVDKDSRNTLYRQMLRVVRDKKPLYFLIENVRGILSIDGGRAFKRIEKDFSAAGYRVQYRVLNAVDFGVPQSRIRVIIAGTRSDLPAEFDFSYPKPTHCRQSDRSNCRLLPSVTISEALKGIPEPSEPSNLLNHICSDYKVTNRNFTGHRRTDPNKPCPTLLARGNGKGGVCVIQHPGNLRRLSVRECAILQTFPIDFEFVGLRTSCYRQIGNAVPVLLARHLGCALARLERMLKKCE